MKYRAVIFDLYGTLVDELRYPCSQGAIYQRWASDAAAVLGVCTDDFIRAWSATVPQQSLGEIRTSRGAYAIICDDLNVDVSDEQLERAVATGLKYVSHALKPRTDVVENLASLRNHGVKTGLISNCLADTSKLWPSTPIAPLFDTVVLSYEVGMMKPILASTHWPASVSASNQMIAYSLGTEAAVSLRARRTLVWMPCSSAPPTTPRTATARTGRVQESRRWKRSSA